jgi:hypothetical protein
MSFPEDEVMDDYRNTIRDLEEKYSSLRTKYDELINSVSGCYHTDEEKHQAALKYIRQSSKATW